MQDSVIESAYVYEVPKIEKLKKFINNVIKFLGNIFFILLVALIVVVLIYNVYTKKNGTTGQAPLVSAYVIISPSMVPTINVQDAVIAYKPNTEKLKKGDIITFTSTDARYTGLTVTHRVLKVVTQEDGKKAFMTKGDNNTTPDDTEVLSQNIYGKVILVIPWLGYLQYFLTKSYGWILLIVLPCLGIIIYDISKLFRTLKNAKVRKDVKFKDVEILDFDDGENDSSDIIPEKEEVVEQIENSTSEALTPDNINKEELLTEENDNESELLSLDYEENNKDDDIEML